MSLFASALKTQLANIDIPGASFLSIYLVDIHSGQYIASGTLNSIYTIVSNAT
jgi:hypothetical protein